MTDKNIGFRVDEKTHAVLSRRAREVGGMTALMRQAIAALDDQEALIKIVQDVAANNKIEHVETSNFLQAEIRTQIEKFRDEIMSDMDEKIRVAVKAEIEALKVWMQDSFSG